MSSQITVCLGIPTTCAIEPQSYYNHLALSVQLGRKARIVIPPVMKVFPHDRARTAVWDACKKYEVDYLLFVDSDMIVEPNLFDLLYAAIQSENAQMAVAHCYRRGYPFTSTWTKTGPDGNPYNVTAGPGYPIVEIDSSGLAANLIDFKWCHKHLEEPVFFQGHWQDEFFWEDAWFCKRIKRHGGKIVAVPDARTQHAVDTLYVCDENVERLRKEVIEDSHGKEEPIKLLRYEDIKKD